MAEGQEITDKMQERLVRYEVLEEDKVSPAEWKEITETEIDTKDVNKRLKLTHISTLDYPSAIVGGILFESKAQPWRLIINTLCNYIDWVYTHSINVSLISLMIAVSAGYGAEALHELALGALLHDVGKLMVPKTLLQKNSALNQEEKLLMRQHCDLGVSITEGCGLPAACTEVIQQHHERNDGSGYPFGLEGNQIHPYTKIVMIADVVDAMTSVRPYRPAMEISEALEMLKKAKNMFSEELIVLLEGLLQ